MSLVGGVEFVSLAQLVVCGNSMQERNLFSLLGKLLEGNTDCWRDVRVCVCVLARSKARDLRWKGRGFPRPLQRKGHKLRTG